MLLLFNKITTFFQNSILHIISCLITLLKVLWHTKNKVLYVFIDQYWPFLTQTYWKKNQLKQWSLFLGEKVQWDLFSEKNSAQNFAYRFENEFHELPELIHGGCMKNSLPCQCPFCTMPTISFSQLCLRKHPLL